MESEKFNKDSEMADFVADDLIAAWNRRAKPENARQRALQAGICPMCEDCPDGCPVEAPNDSRNKPENEPLTLEELIQRCTPKAAEMLKRGLFGAVKVCAVDETIQKTNADRIRSMSDEELARFLGDEPPYLSTYDKYLEWLQQPAKEERHEVG